MNDKSWILYVMVPLCVIFMSISIGLSSISNEYKFEINANNESVELLKLTIDSTINCFNNFDLSYECEKANGYLIPSTNSTGKYWTCNSLNYTVRSC